jgi:hypothetical protein
MLKENYQILWFLMTIDPDLVCLTLLERGKSLGPGQLIYSHIQHQHN